MSKFAIMSEAGSRIARIKEAVEKFVKVGVTPLQIDALVEKHIVDGGDRPSFKMVPGYHHSTCININAVKNRLCRNGVRQNKKTKRKNQEKKNSLGCR